MEGGLLTSQSTFSSSIMTEIVIPLASHPRIPGHAGGELGTTVFEKPPLRWFIDCPPSADVIIGWPDLSVRLIVFTGTVGALVYRHTGRVCVFVHLHSSLLPQQPLLLLFRLLLLVEVEKEVTVGWLFLAPSLPLLRSLALPLCSSNFFPNWLTARHQRLLIATIWDLFHVLTPAHKR